MVKARGSPLRPVLVSLLLLVGMFAGCTSPLDKSGEAVQREEEVTLDVAVVDAASRVGLPDAVVLLTSTSGHHLTATTDFGGRASFTLEPPIACSVTVELAGYRSAGEALNCRWSHQHTVYLNARTAPVQPPPPPASIAPEPQPVEIEGIVFAIDGHALADVEVALDLSSPVRTSKNGAFRFDALPGEHSLSVQAGCWGSAQFPLTVTTATAIDLRLTVLAPPPAAPNLTSVLGPGPGMATLAWTDVPNATHFHVLRENQSFAAVGHSLAFTIQEAGNFTVAALDACGQHGEVSNATAAAPLPAAGLAMPPARAPLYVQVEEHSYPARTAQGATTQAWRTIIGTGGAHANYLTVTPDGALIDNGAGQLAISADDGQTWTGFAKTRLATPGAVAVAPDGDLVAFTSPATEGGTGMAYRYSTTTKAWTSMPVQVPPGFGQPWISALKGPFAFQERVAAYACVVQGTTAILFSIDCLTYAPLTLNTALLAAVPALNLSRLDVQPDVNRDWTGAVGAFAAISVENGVAVVDPRNEGAGAVEPTAALHGALPWAAVTLPSIPGSIARIDSEGRLHALAFDRSSSVLTYSWSHDGGTTWTNLTRDVGGRVLQADLHVNAKQDQAVIAVHIAKRDSLELVRVLRLRDLDAPRFEAMFDIGDGDLRFSGTTFPPIRTWGNVQNPVERLDVLAARLLPSGKIVVNFADAAHKDPTIAVEV